MFIRSFACLGVSLSASLLLTSCSNPVPPSPQGAVQYDFESIPDAPRCMVADAMGVGTGTVTANSHGPVIDGTNGDTVQCSVSGSGSTYSFSGTIQDAAGQSFSIQGTVDSSMTTSGTATVTVFNSAAMNTYESDPSVPCTVSVNTAGTSLGVGAGLIWGSFTCPKMDNNNSSDDPSCSISSNSVDPLTNPGGYFVFENCSGS